MTPTTSSARVPAGALDGAPAAFGVAAAIVLLFNTALAWIKDAYDPLNNAMAALTGHHWITHGLTDLVVFLAVGGMLLWRGVQIDGTRLVVAVASAALIGGGGLALWFVLF